MSHGTETGGRTRFETAALELAAMGYHVFPCRSRTKVPLTARGFKDATTDENQIREWWGRHPDANVAIACGESEIVVLDIDAKGGADPREIIPELGLDDYLIVWTGEAPEPCEKYPNSLAGARGAHVYFAGQVATTKTSMEGVEVRGVGSYVMAPPSVHESGVPYEVSR
jgi:hypothetical protein